MCYVSVLNLTLLPTRQCSRKALADAAHLAATGTPPTKDGALKTPKKNQLKRSKEPSKERKKERKRERNVSKRSQKKVEGGK